MTTSCFLHSSLYHFPLPPFSSSSRSRNAHTNINFRRIGAPMACLRQDDAAFCDKRTVLFIATSFLPFRGWRAKALEGFAIKETAVKTLHYSQNHEISSYLFLSHLDGSFGKIFSSMLGVIFGFLVSQKGRTAAIAAIKTMNRKLKEQEKLISSFKGNLDAQLLDEQEGLLKQLLRARDEQNALVNQLNSVKSTVTFKEQELQIEENLIEELKLHLHSLETQLKKANSDKRDVQRSLEEMIDSVDILDEKFYLLSLELKDPIDVQNFISSIDEKLSEIWSLNSYYKQTKEELSNSHLQIQNLKDEILKSQEEIEAIDSLINDLNTSVKFLTLDGDDLRRELSVMEETYNNLKLTADEKAALDAKLVREKEKELRQLMEKFEDALNEASTNQVIIDELTQEREILKDSLKNESQKTDNLMYELQITQENLGKSRKEAAEFERHINESRKLQEELELEVSNLSTMFFAVKESLERSIDDEMLTNELRTAKEFSKKSQVELRSMVNELTDAMEMRSNLQNELVEVYKKEETAEKDLKEEKMLVASLNKEVQALESQLFKDQEARKALEQNLEEANRSLGEMNQNVLNLEDAQNHIKNLDIERENLESKVKKLEEELATAKGEILRLRSRNISSSNEQLQKDEGESKMMVSS